MVHKKNINKYYLAEIKKNTPKMPKWKSITITVSFTHSFQEFRSP